MKRAKKAIITIEVLIALIILFSAVVLTTSSIRSLNLFSLKKEIYKNSYIAVLSIRSLLENRKLNINGGEIRGKIDGYSYIIKYHVEKQKRSFIIGETSQLTGNLGIYMMFLFKCNLIIKNRYEDRDYIFYITQYNSMVNDELQ